MLLRLELPGFTRDNWKSNVRGEVKIHRKYSDMESWNGAETADITYNDIHGDFTRLLIDKGYLPSAVWQNARPLYYLEVKTTTKECNTRFFMSKSQHQRVSPRTILERLSHHQKLIREISKDETDGIDRRTGGDPSLHDPASLRPWSGRNRFAHLSGS
jgi:hypothetical protein